MRQSKSVSSSQRFLGLGRFRETFAAAELVGGIGLVFHSLENIFCVIIFESLFPVPVPNLRVDSLSGLR